MMKSIYLAGGLFNAGERLHNLMLAKALTELGYEVILPQREALKFFNEDGKFDIDGVADDCRAKSTDSSLVCVGNSDGPDADSGTCTEVGMALIATGRAVVYRTDFRTALDRELGVNAMLRGKGTTLVYEPCFFTDLSEVDAYYKKLAFRIHEAVQALPR